MRNINQQPALAGENRDRKRHRASRDRVIGANVLFRLGEAWVLDGRYRQLSPRTLECRAESIRNLTWWLNHEGLTGCDAQAIKGYLRYCVEPQDEGRWGCSRPALPGKPATGFAQFSRLRSFFRWALGEELIDVNPMEGMKGPVVRQDQVTPFSEEQIEDLLRAARRTDAPERNAAILYLLLDTGIRAAELCNLTRQDVDTVALRAVVRGKGNKSRNVYFGRTTARAIRAYYRRIAISIPRSTRRPIPVSDNIPAFLSEREDGAGRKVPLSRNGLGQLIQRLGESAGIRGVRCSPHTFRHTAAVMFLRAGGHVFALKEMLGHETLQMTNRYAMIAQADVQAQHAMYSPVEHLKRSGS